MRQASGDWSHFGCGCRVSGLRGLVTRAAEGAFLIRLLSEHNLGRLAARSDEGIRRALREPLRLREWVCSSTGEAAASGLISLLISEHLTASGVHPPPFPSLVSDNSKARSVVSWLGEVMSSSSKILQGSRITPVPKL